jgi:hypothetical protein
MRKTAVTAPTTSNASSVKRAIIFEVAAAELFFEKEVPEPKLGIVILKKDDTYL